MSDRKNLRAYLVSVFAAAWLIGNLSPVACAEPLFSHAKLSSDFGEQIRILAAKCEELGLFSQAKQTLAFWIDRDPRRQYLFCSMGQESVKPIQPATDLETSWRAKLTALRKAHAARLFELAKVEVAGGSAAMSFQLLHEVRFQDPQHVEASRILRATSDETRARLRQPRVDHPKYGWPRGKWWQIDSPHFQISTDAGPQSGSELAERLEEFHAVWRQLFFDYWGSRQWLSDRFGGKASPEPSERKHQVVLFRDHEEYLRQLTPIEPKIALTVGYYLKGNKTSYFRAGDERTLSIWYHEAAHQLFQESGDPIRDVGEKWNFWVVEGIAVYLESTQKHDGYFTVGGFDADRLQFARSRVMGGERLLPIAELSVLGREELQHHPEIRSLYTQAAGLTHFLLDSHGVGERDEFIRRLAKTYAGQDNPSTFATLPDISNGDFGQKFRDFLQVADDELRFLRPASLRRNLSLAGARIQDASLKQLSGSDQLEWLDLAYTPITDVGIQNLGVLPCLKQLTLVSTRVSDKVHECLTPLPCLAELDLSGTPITDQALVGISKLTRLKALRLAHTAVTDAGIKHLTNLRDLEELDVDQTAVSREAIVQLKSRLPRLQ